MTDFGSWICPLTIPANHILNENVFLLISDVI